MSRSKKTVAVLFHSERDEAAQKLLDWLSEQGHKVCMPDEDAEALARPDLAADLGTSDITIAVSVGGDGTMLRAFDLLAGHGVPVIGINVGHLGYLTEFELHDMTGAVQLALQNKLPIEDRMMIEATLEPATEPAVDPADSAQPADSADPATDSAQPRDLGPWFGLNEVILEKRDLGHTIRTEVTFDDQEFATYAADGLIISTPTGSTAYSLSAGGAVVAPTHQSLQLTPVAPHMLFDRSIILEPDAKIRCRMLGVRSANLAVDGRSVATLNENDTLVVKRSDTQARLITSPQTSFQGVLKRKLGLINR